MAIEHGVTPQVMARAIKRGVTPQVMEAEEREKANAEREKANAARSSSGWSGHNPSGPTTQWSNANY